MADMLTPRSAGTLAPAPRPDEGVCPSGHPCYAVTGTQRQCIAGEYAGYRLGMLPDADGETCETCGRTAPADEHPCRFAVACSCWRSITCQPVPLAPLACACTNCAPDLDAEYDAAECRRYTDELDADPDGWPDHSSADTLDWYDAQDTAAEVESDLAAAYAWD